jgi:transposase
VLLRESGMTQPEITEAMGVSLSTVNRAHMAYDHGGRKALQPKPKGTLRPSGSASASCETRTEEGSVDPGSETNK